jgi:transposase-like protein
MGGKVQREKDLAEARLVRERNEAEKKRKALRMLANEQTVKDTAKAVHASEATIQQWKGELGNG